MASYLLAIAVGPFAIVDAGKAGKTHFPVRVLTFPRRANAVAAVAHQTARLIALLEDYTAIPMPFPKIDIVTVPHLFGAMENPGLITFDADIVFDGDRHYAVIAAHELAHQWFGNYVTPMWWDDLWLSEAFASWLGERVAAQNEGHPPSELHVAFTRENALAADGEAGAQPLHRPVAFDPDNAFDSIAYDKGEAVLAMFERWIKPDVFRTALRGYLQAHANGSVTTADLVAALTATAGAESAGALAAYVDHAGPPIVELALACEPERGATLTAKARDHLRIPVCVRSAGKPQPTCALVGDSTPIALGTTCPSWVIATNGGYYSVVWTTNGPRGPLPAWHVLSLGDKLALATDLSAATARGDLTPAAAIAQITELAANRDAYAQYTAVAIAQALDPLVADAARERWETWVAQRLAPHLLGQPRGMIEERIRGALLDLVAPERWPAVTRARAQAAVAKTLAKKVAPWESSVRLGADHAAFARIAELAHDSKLDSDQREGAMVDLAQFGPAEIPDAMTELLELAADPRRVVRVLRLLRSRRHPRGRVDRGARPPHRAAREDVAGARGRHARCDGDSCAPQPSAPRSRRRSHPISSRSSTANRASIMRSWRSIAASRAAQRPATSRLRYSSAVRTTFVAAALLLASCGKHSDHASGVARDTVPITITTRFPGASPTETASSVTTPLERQLGQALHLDALHSRSTEGLSVVIAEFAAGTDVDVASQEVQKAINAASQLLPQQLPAPPTYNRASRSGAVLRLTLASNELPLVELATVANDLVAQKLSQVAGVGMVDVCGPTAATRITIDPAMLAATGKTMEDVARRSMVPSPCRPARWISATEPFR